MSVVPVGIEKLAVKSTTVPIAASDAVVVNVSVGALAVTDAMAESAISLTFWPESLLAPLPVRSPLSEPATPGVASPVPDTPGKDVAEVETVLVTVSSNAISKLT